MKTLSNQYKLIKEGKGSKDGFLRNAKRQFPNHVPNHATYNQAAKILKQKGIISENFVGSQMIGGYAKQEKQGYEKAFENFLKEAEAKAEEKKVTKEVEEDLAKTYDYKDEKNPDNMIFGQIQMGVYYEAKLDKNEGKTLDEIKDIVFKNLAKDPIHYTKTGQFGVEVGYTDEAPSLGATDEPKGKYKSSGYGNLKEHSIPVGGGIVTDHVFSSVDYKDFFGLNEQDKLTDDDVERSEKYVSNIKMATDLLKNEELKEDEAPLEAMASIDDIVTKAEEMARGVEERGDKVNIDMIVDKALSELRTDIKNALEASLNLDTSDR
mgnify:CR=1 FL=1